MIRVLSVEDDVDLQRLLEALPTERRADRCEQQRPARAQ